MARDKRLNKYNEWKGDKRYKIYLAWCGYPYPRYEIFFAIGMVEWNQKPVGFCDTIDEAIAYCEKLKALNYSIRDDLWKMEYPELQVYAASH